MKRFFLYWRAKLSEKYLRYRYEVKSVTHPNYDFLVDLHNLIKVSSFSRYRATYAMHIELRQAITADAGLACERMKLCADAILSGKLIDSEWTMRREQSTTLDQWLTVVDGCYVEPEKIVEQYMLSSARLLDLAIKHQHVTGDQGVQRANQRMLRNVLLDMQVVLELLVSCQLQCLR